MATIFISGSMRIENIHADVRSKLDEIINSQVDIIVGDADGVDASFQMFLNTRQYRNVTIYCSGLDVRNNIGRWPVRSISTDKRCNSRLFYVAKDLEMASKCDFGLMVWDSRSTGTLSNVIELLKQKKRSTVFVDKLQKFLEITDVASFEELILSMNKDDLERADKKIQLRKKIDELKQLNFL